MTKINIHIFIEDKTFAEAETLRAQIETFLENNPDAKLLTFSYTEEGE